MKPEREEFANRGMTKENRHRRTGNGDLAEGIRNQELETNETRNLPFNWFGTTSADVLNQGRLASAFSRLQRFLGDRKEA
jgi:hypothetical protein